MRRKARPGRPELMAFADYIRDLRQKKGLYLEHVAKATGFSINYISEVERGIRSPNDELISSLAKLFNVEEEELFFLAGKLPPSFVEEAIENESLQSLIVQIARNKNLSKEKKVERYKMISEILKALNEDVE